MGISYVMGVSGCTAEVWTTDPGREQTLAFAETTQDDLRSHFAPHTVLGPLDGYQWLVGNARHVETHIAHISEIREMAGFPR